MPAPKACQGTYCAELVGRYLCGGLFTKAKMRRRTLIGIIVFGLPSCIIGGLSILGNFAFSDRPPTEVHLQDNTGRQIIFSVPSKQVNAVLPHGFTFSSTVPGLVRIAGAPKQVATDPAFIVVTEAVTHQAENQRRMIEEKLLAGEVKGREGYRIFDESVGKGKSQVITRTSVFSAVDGHMVVVRDPGDWSYDYMFDEIWPDDIEVKANVRKKSGDNFKEIDQRINSLVSSLIRPGSKNGQ